MKQLIIKRVQEYLQALSDPCLSSERYGDVFCSIGEEMGNVIAGYIQNGGSHTKLICTAEDADFLVRGVLNTLSKHSINPSLTVFWHKRRTIGSINIAPIVMKYDEPINVCDTMIVVKSIISSSCTISTQITELFDKLNPKTTLIFAPVIYKDAIPNLLTEFPPCITETFRFLYVREDSILNENIVVPGIGGDVEQRLGIQRLDNTAERIPSLVRERVTIVQKSDDVPYQEV